MLSDAEILGQMEDGNVVILPFRDQQLNSNSYDVTLGNWYYRQKQYDGVPPYLMPLIRYGTADAMELMWDEPIYADKFITLRPKETILCHTEEFIGGRNIITTEMKSKSTTGRHCVFSCKCAGLGDVGYVYRWTMEMSNDSNFHIEIPVGERVAQIVFFNVGMTLHQYNGRYGMEDWQPSDMLPKPKKHA